MSISCDKCGIKSEADDAFNNCCPACLQKGMERVSYFSIAIIVFALLGLILMIIPSTRPNWIYFNIAFVVMFSFPMVLLHELAHVLAARLMGQKVYKVQIGIGKRIFRLSILGVVLDWNLAPVAGQVSVAIPPSAHARMKFFSTVLAGPLVNIITIAVLMIISSTTSYGLKNINTEPAPLTALLICNILLVLSSLWPHRTRLQSSDGSRLLNIPGLPDAELNNLFGSYYCLLAMQAMDHKDSNRALINVNKGIKITGGNPSSLMAKGVIYSIQGNFGAAKTTFSRVLEHEHLAPTQKFLAFNGIAWVDFMLGDRLLLDEADRLSALAFMNIPWIPAVCNTRGAVLVELDQVDEGLKLLLETITETSSPRDRALVACLLAIAEKKKGNDEQSRHYLQIATEQDPGCLLLNKTQSIVCSGSEVSPFIAVATDSVGDSCADSAFSKLETAILDWYRVKYRMPALSEQIENITILEREKNDDGLVLTFRVPDDAPLLDLNHASPLIGPRIVSPDIDMLNQSRLSLTGGRLNFLAIITAEFPDQINDFELVDS